MRRGAFPDVAALLSSGVVVASASTLLLWAVPRSDDFCYAATHLTWSEFVVQKYRTWAGRWLVMALYGAIWPAIDITSALYSVLLGILLVGLLVSLVVLMRLAWG